MCLSMGISEEIEDVTIAAEQRMKISRLKRRFKNSRDRIENLIRHETRKNLKNPPSLLSVFDISRIFNNDSLLLFQQLSILLFVNLKIYTFKSYCGSENCIPLWLTLLTTLSCNDLIPRTNICLNVWGCPYSIGPVMWCKAASFVGHFWWAVKFKADVRCLQQFIKIWY